MLGGLFGPVNYKYEALGVGLGSRQAPYGACRSLKKGFLSFKNSFKAFKKVFKHVFKL